MEENKLGIYYKGIFFLAAAAFLGEGIEVLVNMILARELGPHGLGLYMSILPSIFFIVLLASFELPVSISKFIAEREDRYHRNILHHAISITIVFSAVLFLAATVIIPFIPVFDKYHPYVRWLVLILIPIISFLFINHFVFSKSEIYCTNYSLRAIFLFFIVAFPYF